MRAAFIAAQQVAAPRSYDLQGGVAFNEHQQFQAHFDEIGVEVIPEGTGTYPLRLQLEALNCGGKIQKIPPGRREISRNRVRYARPELGMEEWFIHGPMGVEQGFTLEGNPCAGESGVVLELRASGGLVPKLDGATKGVLFEREGAPTGLRYDELHAEDAAGKTLRSWMTVEDARIALHIDTSTAKFPVVIDPLLWQQQAILKPSEANWSPEDHTFGESVALFGNTALIGHSQYSSQEMSPASGAAYIFVRSGSSWVQQARLVASDGTEGASFGLKVALGENIAAISSRHSLVGVPSQATVYVFERTGSCWTQKAKLNPPDQGEDLFGSSLAIDGATLLVGAPGDDEYGSLAGAAYVFEREQGSWVQKQKLTIAQPNLAFGTSVAIEGDTILVGAIGLVLRREGTRLTGLQEPYGLRLHWTL
ncbi:MAG: FG-GAP repeat protein [Polyangiaceae bacterium]|nr:FG-GAP repeat protein [Polyangiaceae bacterium]